MARSPDWESARRRQLLADPGRSGLGEGSRWDPSFETSSPAASQSKARLAPPRIPALWKLDQAEARLLTPKQVSALVAAGGHIGQAKRCTKSGELARARRKALAAWERVQPVVRKLRSSGQPAKARLARKLNLPFDALAKAGVDVRAGTASRQSSCTTCFLLLSAADLAMKRLRHVDC